jgi:hypothetical protein
MIAVRGTVWEDWRRAGSPFSSFSWRGTFDGSAAHLGAAHGTLSALVDAQDHEMTVGQSRQFIAERFSVTENQVRQIERKGLDNLWPPLPAG